MFRWFSAAASVRCGQELASLLLREIAASAAKSEAKFSAKLEKALLHADERLQVFKAGERLNVYKKARLANAFLWTLKDGGCRQEYANQLTDWLSVRL